jgi:hypothetical protein
VTEHQQNPEGPPDPEVNPAEPDAAPTVANTPAPIPDSDTAPTVIAQTPLAASEDAPTTVPEAAPAPAAAAKPEQGPAPGTKPATPPPEPPPLPPPPEPPPIALDSGPRATAADRPEIPVAAAFVGGFLLAKILRRLAR